MQGRLIAGSFLACSTKHHRLHVMWPAPSEFLGTVTMDTADRDNPQGTAESSVLRD